MEASCCPVCKKRLGDNWSFCPACETYFDAARQPLTIDTSAAVDYNELSLRYRKRRLSGALLTVSIASVAVLLAIFAAVRDLGRHPNGRSDTPLSTYQLVGADEAANAQDTLQARTLSMCDEIDAALGCAVHPGMHATDRPFFNLYMRRPVAAARAQAGADFAANTLSDIRSHFMPLDSAYDLTVTVYAPDDRPIAFSSGSRFRSHRKSAYSCAPRKVAAFSPWRSGGLDKTFQPF